MEMNQSLENFSNELFYEIFDYLDGIELFEAFSNLNAHFQRLISNPLSSIENEQFTIISTSDIDSPLETNNEYPSTSSLFNHIGWIII